MKRRGFTLIELLVVIGVMGILAGLLMPALSLAKKKAWRSHCSNNLRQIGLAVRMYADDNQQRYPIIRETISSDHGGTVGANAVFRIFFEPLLEGASVLKCKSDRSDAFDRNGASYAWNASMNGKLIDNDADDQPAPGQPLAYDSAARHFGRQNAIFEDGRVGERESN